MSHVARSHAAWMSRPSSRCPADPLRKMATGRKFVGKRQPLQKNLSPAGMISSGKVCPLRKYSNEYRMKTSVEIPESRTPSSPANTL